ncbi:Flp family type IVb pilin [Nostocoides sp. HKS02]|nr:Flp family type IVb pilin [Tetrasphaera sp. HKS02]
MNEFWTFGRTACCGGLGVKALLASAHDRGDRGRLSSRWGDRGATAVEYAIMVSLIAVVIVSGVSLFGQNIIHLFNVPSSAL